MCFEKLFKFEICLKIKNNYFNIFKNNQNNLMKFIKVCKSL